MSDARQPWWRRFLARLGSALDEDLPVAPDEREERDTAGLDPAALAERRQLRLKQRMLEKEGKGGYR